MARKSFAMMLAALVLLTALNFQTVHANGAEDQAPQQIRAKVQKLSAGGDTRVEVKLRDGSKLSGYIREADQDSFTVFDNKTGATDKVSYSDTTSVKKAGGGLSMKTWLILGAAAAGAITTWVIVKPALCDGGAQTRGPC